ncbi:glucokinase [Aliagarivorans marinus]|uniref:glucokinase n=1 Tax=Aliagarivorans marinus TaxID=561965 RepID=UPI000429B60F|nr:glucokinase [Aliagarivorans marinus]
MSEYGLVADVGGTNIRLALVNLSDGNIDNIQKFLCADYPTITDVIRTYLSSQETQVTQACIAIACPTDKDWIEMTNHSWAFSQKQVKADLELDNLHLINDFTGIAMSIPTLGEDQKVQVKSGEVNPDAPIAVYGPGTGLGVAHLVKHQGEFICLPGEGGHVEFAPSDDKEMHILKFLQNRLGHVSAERLMSGPGLVNIYQGLADFYQKTPENFVPADITERGLDGSCELCRETMEVFCRVLGSFGGNLALNLSTFGGIYIAGGIIGRFMDFFKASDFIKRFEDKGRFKAFVNKVPVFVITESQPGLQGAAAYLRQANGYRI